MALQDVCGLFGSPHSSYSSSTFVIHEDFHSSSWREPTAQHGGVPLSFSIPHSQNNLIFASHRDAFFSLGSQPSTASVTCPFSLSHGTTTLAFAFQGGVIAAADSRASCAGLVACPAVEKISPIHSHLVVTSSGSGADCMLWERILAREIRLYQLRHGRRLSVFGAAKLLSSMLHPFKGTNVCVALTLCGWDGEKQGKEREAQQTVEYEGSMDVTSNKGLSVCEKPISFCFSAELPEDALSCPESEIQRKWKDPEGRVEPFMSLQHDQRKKTQEATDQNLISYQNTTITKQTGPRLCYVCSDGLFLKGELFSVGSGSPYAYSVLDGAVRWEMCIEEAVSVAREAVYRATHRDAYSGNNVDIFHISARGWRRREREDLREEYYRERKRQRECKKVREIQRKTVE